MDCYWLVRSRRPCSRLRRIFCWESSRDGCGCRDQLAPKTQCNAENGLPPFAAEGTPIGAGVKGKTGPTTAREGVRNQAEILPTRGADAPRTCTAGDGDPWNSRWFGLSEA